MTDNRNDDFDFREVKDDEKVDIVDDGTKGGGLDDSTDNGFEDVCFVCRRPESKAGKMFHLPNNICICDDCMHKTMDMVSQFDYQNMLNNPNLLNELNKHSGGFPNIGIFNMDGLNNSGGIPNSQKVKKKKEKSEQAAIDIKNIPAPHKIKEKLDEYVIG